MPLVIATTVGSQSLGDGQQAVGVRQAKTGGLIVAKMHGDHYEQASRGNVYIQSTTPLGLAVPIYTGTALAGGGLPVWNPPGSGVRVVPIFYSFGRASGANTFFAIGLMLRRLDAIATGQVMTALAETTPFNGHAFNGVVSKAKSSNSGTNTVTAGGTGDWAITLGSTGAEVDATTTGLHMEKFDFNGVLSLPPGTLMYIASTLASVGLVAASMCWEEVPA